MEFYCLAEPMYARRKAWKGRNVHLNVWAGKEFERESQNSIRLAAFCVREEKDFSRRGLSTVDGHLVGGLAVSEKAGARFGSKPINYGITFSRTKSRAVVAVS